MSKVKARILDDRLAQVMGWSLLHGNHPENTEGHACVMEAVAYVAGRKWSDSPPENVAALFVRADSVYKTLPGVDAWDAERDASKWPGGSPCIAHPPCRGWGRLRHMAKTSPAEKRLALVALDFVDANGGVLEHPHVSTLWKHAEGRRGFLYTVDQSWWGHRARKRTTLYIVGVHPQKLPPIPIVFEEPTHIVAGGRPRDAVHAKRKRKAWPCRPSVTPKEAESTPLAFAEWLVEVARRCA